MSTVEKIFLGFTVIAVSATIFSSPYTASIFGAGSSGLARVYSSLKH